MSEYVEIDAQELNDYISNLEDENEALKVQVEQLRQAAMTEGAGPLMRAAIDATPAQCLAEIKAQAVIDAIDAHKNKLLTFDFDTAIRVTDLIRYANQLRQQADKGE